ncbi:MAG TPA: hypothetical protein P5150_08635 [Candidatus Ratteibacteria bacterium]|nr:hypothetical protein [Candidatus Ratteibacteria bacterium]
MKTKILPSLVKRGQGRFKIHPNLPLKKEGVWREKKEVMKREKDER